MIDVIDNFLDKKDFLILQSSLTAANFPWYYMPFKVHEGDGKDQFYHLYTNGDKLHSKNIDPIKPILKKLDIKKTLRIKANLGLKKYTNEVSNMHIDFKDCKTAIFYFNTNNGCTKFEKSENINSIENRIVIFDSNLKHCAVDCTDKQFRIVINFNYIENDRK
tara:strand:+ start:109 stop:597 length:489 start_codon:yes stop_codon:yes gene_type:complete